MTYDEIREQLGELNPEAILFDGYEAALIGYVQRFNEAGNHVLVALYDRGKCIDCLTAQGMTPEEAEEFFQFNSEGCYAGEHTPAFATIFQGSRRAW